MSIPILRAFVACITPLLLAPPAVLRAAAPASTPAVLPEPAAAPPDGAPLVLWYRQPAKGWEEALPVGNGHLGAMVYGGVPTEHIHPFSICGHLQGWRSSP